MGPCHVQRRFIASSWRGARAAGSWARTEKRRRAFTWPEPTARPATRRAAPPSLDRSHDYAAWRECVGEMVAVRTTFRGGAGPGRGPARTLVGGAPRRHRGAGRRRVRRGQQPALPRRFRDGDRQRDRRGRDRPAVGFLAPQATGLGVGRGRRGRASPAARRPPARAHHRPVPDARAHRRPAVRRHPDARPPRRPAVGWLPVAGRAIGAARRAPRRPPVRDVRTDAHDVGRPGDAPQRLPRGRRGHARHADRDGDRRLPHPDAAAVAPARDPALGRRHRSARHAPLVDPRPALRIDSAGCG